jgi:protease IV
VKRAIVAILAALGGLVILGFLFILAISWAVLSPTPLPSQVVLELDLGEGMVETMPEDPVLLALERRRLRTREVVEALERAREDRRVVGLLVRADGGLGGWAAVEEVRESVLRFRESGKPAVLFAETFGEFGPGQGGYHLATGFDEVVMQPSGDVGLMPLTLEAPFFREALEKLDLEPRFDRRWEYKDGIEYVTRDGFSDAAREALEAVLESILQSVVEGVSEARGLPQDSVRTLVREGPHMARQAETAGLVDRLGYLDDARTRVLEMADDEGERIDFRRYIDRDGRIWNRGPRVALIYGVGTIVRGRSSYDPFTGGTGFGAASVAANIRAAVDDDRVQAILFRVDSPGGSYVASDVVRRELARARAEGKPVVVSMGNAAASGGYLVSVDADRIVANPSTLTGSIGVMAGKVVTGEMWSRLGVEWDRIEAGGESTFFSGTQDFSEEEWERFQAHLDRVYDEFLELVVAGRGMDRERVHEAARGRVWTGRDALEVGLVDDLGGFATAVGVVRELLDLEEDVPIHLVRFPPERTLFQLLMEDGWRAGVAALVAPGEGGGELARFLRPVVGRAAAAGLLGELPGPVRMMPLEVPAP